MLTERHDGAELIWLKQMVRCTRLLFVPNVWHMTSVCCFVWGQEFECPEKDSSTHLPSHMILLSANTNERLKWELTNNMSHVTWGRHTSMGRGKMEESVVESQMNHLYPLLFRSSFPFFPRHHDPGFCCTFSWLLMTGVTSLYSCVWSAVCQSLVRHDPSSSGVCGDEDISSTIHQVARRMVPRFLRSSSPHNLVSYYFKNMFASFYSLCLYLFRMSLVAMVHTLIVLVFFCFFPHMAIMGNGSFLSATTSLWSCQSWNRVQAFFHLHCVHHKSRLSMP